MLPIHEEREQDAYEQHHNGVHVNCAPADCNRAGKVERFHSHDYPGLLVCGCSESD